MQGQLKRVVAGSLDIAYEESGAQDAPVVILMHGFPYDVRAYDAVTSSLVAAGRRVIVPYLRGYGPTRFLTPSTLRSGQQAVLGQDLLALMDALSIGRAVLAGYDWGGRAACIVSALWPERVVGLLTGGGYNIQNIAASENPIAPHDEYKYWYQYYFHSERGRSGLTANRHEFCKLLWRLWSPTWSFDDSTFDRTAISFDNPDFVNVVIHSYRHRFGLVAGDPDSDVIEKKLAARPKISVPAISMEGANGGVMASGDRSAHAPMFTSRYEHRVILAVGHNLPQEAPIEFSQAVIELGDTGPRRLTE
jgi:pimeloyl-ACP methyl ester carboxylesterase